MNQSTPVPVIQMKGLQRRFGKTDAVNGLSLTVMPGRCYGFFGRNGAGKTTAIKCLLNLLKPTAGEALLFGKDPARHETEVKRRLAYVPDQVAFYPWMTIQSWFEYLASFRERWNLDLQNDFLSQFGLDSGRKVNTLSRGEKVQVALIGAMCPEPELLILDEPTSGLDPLIRREFIRTVIGGFQEIDPERRTIFVSTHLITEFEGLIDEFTVIDRGREILTLESDAARDQFKRVRARFEQERPEAGKLPCLHCVQTGREFEFTSNGDTQELIDRLKQMRPEHLEVETLSLEEIFLASLKMEKERTAA